MELKVVSYPRSYQAFNAEGQAQRLAFLEGVDRRNRAITAREETIARNLATEERREKVLAENAVLQAEIDAAHAYNQEHGGDEGFVPRPVPELLEVPELSPLPEIPEEPAEPTAPDTIPLAVFTVEVFEDGALDGENPQPILQLEVTGVPPDASAEVLAEHTQRFIREHNLLADSAEGEDPETETHRPKVGDRIAL